MLINKANWTADGDHVRLSMPFAKVDQERRIVSGFATLDNIDHQGDIVSAEASLDAFNKFRGNLREMHQPTAVGKVISFKEDRYFDPNSKKFYSGIYVSAYVSKGAQDTWEKVLDGTLSGFSIGGNITKTMDSYDEKIDKSVRIIKEYELHELSLVDNPANQFANVISIQKGEIGGYLAKAAVDNVYWCGSDDIVQLSESGDASCPSCSNAMKNIGFVEKNDSENVEMVKFLVDSAKGISTIKIQKEVNPMTEETTEAVEAVADEAVAKSVDVVEDVEVAPEAPVEAPAQAEDAVVEPETVEAEKSVDAVVDVTTEISKTVSDIQDSLTNALSDLAATVKSMQDSVDAITKSLEAVKSEVKEVKGSFDEFGKRVDLVEQDTAFRKSGDLGEIVQEPATQVQKSLWGGRFLSNADLFI